MRHGLHPSGSRVRQDLYYVLGIEGANAQLVKILLDRVYGFPVLRVVGRVELPEFLHVLPSRLLKKRGHPDNQRTK